MTPSNHQTKAADDISQAKIRKVSMFMTKSPVNGKWTYTSKIYMRSKQTQVVKEVFANSMTALINATKIQMNQLTNS